MHLRRLLIGLLIATAIALPAELQVGRSTLDEGAVKALVIDDGEARAAFVVCDRATISEATVRAARQQIAARSSIPEANVMVSATGVASTRAAIAPPRIAESVRLAVGSMQAASAWTGAGKDDGIGFYNRFLMKDGVVRANRGRPNPEIVQPAGEADPELTIALFESAAGNAIAIYGAFSLHTDTLDYVAPAARTLAKIYGPDMVTLWSIGAGANVSNIDVRSPLAPYPPAVEARRVGSLLAGETIKAVARSTRVAAPKLGIARETIKLAPLVAGAPPIETEVQAIALGDTLAWVALPGELWIELGTAIRKASPFSHTLLVGLANGAAGGTLPNRKAYSAGENEPGVHAAAGSGEAIADAAVRLLAAARRSAMRQ